MSRARQAGEERDADGRMPAGVRLVVLVTVSTLTLGALYLLAVRGEAMFIDLAATVQKWLCL